MVFHFLTFQSCVTTQVPSTFQKNSVLHSRTKHIEIRHHFLRDYVQRGDIALEFICTEKPLADIFTKPLALERFAFIRRGVGLTDISEIA